MLFFKKETYKKQTMEEGIANYHKNTAIHLIDVRTKEEYDDGHILGSSNLPLQEISSVTHRYPDKHSPLYIYCRSGARSKRACQYLVKNGYDQVVDLGGIMHYQGSLKKSK